MLHGACVSCKGKRKEADPLISLFVDILTEQAYTWYGSQHYEYVVGGTLIGTLLKEWNF